MLYWHSMNIAQQLMPIYKTKNNSNVAFNLCGELFSVLWDTNRRADKVNESGRL